jgi:hypothetical protein
MLYNVKFDELKTSISETFNIEESIERFDQVNEFACHEPLVTVIVRN